MNKLTNLFGFSRGELNAAIHRELSAVSAWIYHPGFDNQIGGPLRPHEQALPIAIELPPFRPFGRIELNKKSIWLFRFDTSYTVITDAPVLQRKLNALGILSDDDIIHSTPRKDGPLMLKFSNHDSLTLAVTVLRQALYALQAASETKQGWQPL